jgi:hypothetical protein
MGTLRCRNLLQDKPRWRAPVLKKPQVSELHSKKAWAANCAVAYRGDIKIFPISARRNTGID